jgi:hypothetical protein
MVIVRQPDRGEKSRLRKSKVGVETASGSGKKIGVGCRGWKGVGVWIPSKTRETISGSEIGCRNPIKDLGIRVKIRYPVRAVKPNIRSIKTHFRKESVF